MAKIRTMIGFDADDTLWHCEHYFSMTQALFTTLLSDYAEPDHLSEQLLEAERRNMGKYGFGVKAFTLSMIECALEVTNDSVPGSVIREIVEAGKEMLSHPVELLPHARDAIEALVADHIIVLITKGDLLDQERKLAASGLGDMFDGVEIVSDKTHKVYADIFDKYKIRPENAVMVGNSLKSDVIPALESGAWAIHVPHGKTWELERADRPQNQPKFREIADLSNLKFLLKSVFCPLDQKASILP